MTAEVAPFVFAQPAIWCAIPGYDGYEVSALGEVRSWRPCRDMPTPHLLRLQKGGRGYPIVRMRRSDGAWRTHTVHSLVMRTFVGPRPKNMEIRHLDGDRWNNTLRNLAYGTTSENAQDRVAHGHAWQKQRTHCPQGHPYDAANTYVLPSRPNARYCRACHNLRGRRERRRLRLLVGGAQPLAITP